MYYLLMEQYQRTHFADSPRSSLPCHVLEGNFAEKFGKKEISGYGDHLHNPKFPIFFLGVVNMWSITQLWHFVGRNLWIQINNYLLDNLWQYTSYGILILWLDMITVNNLRLDMITVNRAGTTGGWEGVTPPSPKGKERNWAHLPRVAPECWYCETGYILRNFLKNWGLKMCEKVFLTTRNLKLVFGNFFGTFCSGKNPMSTCNWL